MLFFALADLFYNTKHWPTGIYQKRTNPDRPRVLSKQQAYRGLQCNSYVMSPSYALLVFVVLLIAAPQSVSWHIGLNIATSWFSVLLWFRLKIDLCCDSTLLLFYHTRHAFLYHCNKYWSHSVQFLVQHLTRWQNQVLNLSGRRNFMGLVG